MFCCQLIYVFWEASLVFNVAWTCFWGLLGVEQWNCLQGGGMLD